MSREIHLSLPSVTGSWTCYQITTMARAYNQKIKLLWSVPPDYVVPPNPDPYDPKLPSPPAGTGRYYLSTPAGHLEILYALPNDATLESHVEDSWKAPVLFLHGGFGSANCYSNFLPYVFPLTLLFNHSLTPRSQSAGSRRVGIPYILCRFVAMAGRGIHRTGHCTLHPNTS